VYIYIYIYNLGTTPDEAMMIEVRHALTTQDQARSQSNVYGPLVGLLKSIKRAR
jgi:hypothetical protein